MRLLAGSEARTPIFDAAKLAKKIHSAIPFHILFPSKSEKCLLTIRGEEVRLCQLNQRLKNKQGLPAGFPPISDFGRNKTNFGRNLMDSGQNFSLWSNREMVMRKHCHAQPTGMRRRIRRRCSRHRQGRRCH